MAELLATLAPLTLIGGMEVRFEAIDATTGAAVAGVVVTDIAIFSEAGTAELSPSPSDDVEPLFLPIPLEGEPAA